MHPSRLGSVVRFISLVAAAKSHLTYISYLILVSLLTTYTRFSRVISPTANTAVLWSYSCIQVSERLCARGRTQLELLQIFLLD